MVFEGLGDLTMWWRKMVTCCGCRHRDVNCCAGWSLALHSYFELQSKAMKINAPSSSSSIKTREFGTKVSRWHRQDSYISLSLKIFHFAPEIKTALSWTSFLVTTWTHWYHFLVHNREIGLPLSSSQKIVDSYNWGNCLVVSHLSRVLTRADPAGLFWISQGQLRVSTCCDSFRRA